MLDKKRKYIPSGFVEWLFFLLLLYIFVVFSFGYRFGLPVFSLLMWLIPDNVGLGALFFSGIFLVIFLAVLGIIFVKKINRRFSYPILITMIIGFLFTAFSWSVQNDIRDANEDKEVMRNNALGAKTSLDIDKCTLESEPHPNPRYARPIYSIICMATLNNIPTIREDTERMLFEVVYNQNSISTVYIENHSIGNSQNIQIPFYLGEDPTIPEILIKEYNLHAGFDVFRNSNVNLRVSDYFE